MTPEQFKYKYKWAMHLFLKIEGDDTPFSRGLKDARFKMTYGTLSEENKKFFEVALELAGRGMKTDKDLNPVSPESGLEEFNKVQESFEQGFWPSVYPAEDFECTSLHASLIRKLFDMNIGSVVSNISADSQIIKSRMHVFM